MAIFPNSTFLDALYRLIVICFLFLFYTGSIITILPFWFHSSHREPVWDSHTIGRSCWKVWFHEICVLPEAADSLRQAAGRRCSYAWERWRQWAWTGCQKLLWGAADQAWVPSRRQGCLVSVHWKLFLPIQNLLLLTLKRTENVSPTAKLRKVSTSTATLISIENTTFRHWASWRIFLLRRFL